VPVGVDELLRKSKFYWLALPVSLWSRPGWGFNRLEAKAELAADGDVATFDLLPDQEFVTRFQANVQVDIGVDAGMKFSATMPAVAVGLPGVAGGGVSVMTPSWRRILRDSPTRGGGCAAVKALVFPTRTAVTIAVASAS